MASTAFEKLAAAEAEAEKIKQEGVSAQREAVQKANAEGEALIVKAREDAENAMAALEKELAARSDSSKDNINSEITVKCSLIRTRAEERRADAIKFIVNGVTGSGS